MRKRYRQFLFSALITPANVNARPVVFVVLRLGVCVWTIENTTFEHNSFRRP